MLQGVCIDPGQTVLEKGKSYFLFPNGTQHYYVSKFPTQDAHKGCFQTKYFQIIQKEWAIEPEVIALCLDQEKVYKANLIWRRPGYKSIKLQEYYVRPKTIKGYFFKDSNLKECDGCFPLHWFTNFVEVGQKVNEVDISDIDIDFEGSEPFLVENEPKLLNYVQLSLFD